MDYEEILFISKEFLEEELTQNSAHNFLHVCNSKALVNISLIVENSIGIKLTNNDPMFALGYSLEFPTIFPNTETSYSFLIEGSKMDGGEIQHPSTITTNTQTSSTETEESSTGFPGIIFVPVFLIMLVIFQRCKKRV